jgi:hypothetical protein
MVPRQMNHQMPRSKGQTLSHAINKQTKTLKVGKLDVRVKSKKS